MARLRGPARDLPRPPSRSVRRRRGCGGDRQCLVDLGDRARVARAGTIEGRAGLATPGAGLPAVIRLVAARPQSSHLALLAHEEGTLPVTSGRGRTPVVPLS